ncbi:MAG: DegT/DnrJ/EryC1/StrS family aminotransferase, partial [Candidatus Sericytochromatia bacterium]|nr:DegT/DnrJ/EryC1/StrS family aminotransferase [Candidatus Sericytochromatia bacterium]
MQCEFTQMALWGGQPLFTETLHVGRPNLLPKAEILAEITAAFDRLWLTNRGPCLQQFEAELCQRLNVPHCILVSNATLALMILLKALDLQGEVTFTRKSGLCRTEKSLKI